MVKIDNPEHTLQTLRWGPDQLHVECVSNELTWLAAIQTPRPDGSIQRAITDCCWAVAPCKYHQAIEAGTSPVPWIPELALVAHWPNTTARFDWTVA